MANNLPGSYKVEDLEYKGKGSIKFELKAECVCTTSKKQIIEHSQEITVRQSFNEEAKPIIVERDCLIGNCCSKKGQVLVRGSFDKNAFMIGETANVTAEIDNSKGQIKIKNIHLKLRRLITFISTSRKTTQYFNHYVLKESYPGVEIGDKYNKRVMQLTLGGSEQSFEATTIGDLINCIYLLEVSCEGYNCDCCNDDPMVEIPTTLYGVPPKNFEQVQAPTDWNPQVFPSFSVPFDTNFQKDQMNFNNQNPNLQNNMQNMYEPPVYQQKFAVEFNKNN